MENRTFDSAEELIEWLHEEDVKTSEEWQKESNVTIYDPDGWDRKNFQYSWYEELITRAEFEHRAMYSTCMFPPKEAFWKDEDD